MGYDLSPPPMSHSRPGQTALYSPSQKALQSGPRRHGRAAVARRSEHLTLRTALRGSRGWRRGRQTQGLIPARSPLDCGPLQDRTGAPKVPCDGHTTRVARLGGASLVNYLGLLAQFSISTPARRRLLDSRSGVSRLQKPEPDTRATFRGLRRAMPQASGGTGVADCIRRFRVVRPSRESRRWALPPRPSRRSNGTRAT